MRSFSIAFALLTTASISVASAGHAKPTTSQPHLLDRVAIEDLIATYLYRLDHGQANTLADLFTDDGVLDVGGLGPQKGRDAIKAYYAKRSTTRTTRHVSTNLYVVFDDASHARAVHTLTYYAAEGAPPLPAAAPSGVADYAEKLTRGADGRWRFQHRKPTPIFGFGGPAPAPKN
jgi:uncharacterized protein (TIGR02246 family)